jgi:N-sulfoglucosamine sulfohydrolase
MNPIHYLAILCSAFLLPISNEAAKSRPNILIVTVDDMSCDSVGAFGCELEGTTPHIDRLAEQGLRYHYAHVQTGSCYPCRNVLFSGRYSHNTGVEGFYKVKNPDYPHMVDLMKAGGYYVAIRGKVSHSTPYQPYAWDEDLTTIEGQKQHTKDPVSYYRSTKLGIEHAEKAGKPFCLNINISDPHKPFYAMSGKGEIVEDKHVPSRIYTSEEVPIPGFLFDHPEVRLELAHYYSSVRRADDCLGNIMKALDDSGQRKDTVIIFLSDHGMPLPFAKTAVWHHSTRTPWIVVWPGVTKPGKVDKKHMISGVDLLPTLLDIANLPHPKGFDGASFLPTVKGEAQENRNFVYKFHNENSGRNRSPMRSVQSKRFGYIFNPWSDGKRVFKTATRGTATFRTMQKLAATDKNIAARLRLLEYGTPEEFYDYESDPDALHNLINDPEYVEEIEQHRAAMLRFMKESNDHALDAFQHRDYPALVSAYVNRKQVEADMRRKAERKARK